MSIKEKMITLEDWNYEGEGLKAVFDKGEWIVGIKNYKPANDKAHLEMLEKHNETEEQFILLKGKCHLLTLHENNFLCCKMKQEKVYNIPKGIWHTTVMEPGTKMILVERSGTSMDNSEILNLDSRQINTFMKKISEN